MLHARHNVLKPKPEARRPLFLPRSACLSRCRHGGLTCSMNKFCPPPHACTPLPWGGGSGWCASGWLVVGCWSVGWLVGWLVAAWLVAFWSAACCLLLVPPAELEAPAGLAAGASRCQALPAKPATARRGSLPLFPTSVAKNTPAAVSICACRHRRFGLIVAGWLFDSSFPNVNELGSSGLNSHFTFSYCYFPLDSCLNGIYG